MIDELKQAIISVTPDYFSWDKEKQEIYGQTINGVDYDKIKAYLLKALFDVTLKEDDDCTDEQTFVVNQAILPLVGVGENCFYLNESTGDEGILDFKTWYNYDFHDHEFQETFREEKKPYYGTIFGRWTRMFIDGEFFYVTMETEAGHLITAMEDASGNYTSELIPYEWIEGKDHGKKTKGGSRWDMKRDAQGFEKHLEELDKRVRAYQISRSDCLIEQCFNDKHKAIYMVDVSRGEFDPAKLIIASDPEVMKEIHFKTIIADCCRYEKDVAYLLARVEEEQILIKDFMKKEFDDIMLNFKAIKPKK